MAGAQLLTASARTLMMRPSIQIKYLQVANILHRQSMAEHLGIP
jgi:hypothetical protein